MARICELSGKHPITGNKVSHSNNKVRRKFYPNLFTNKFYIPEKDEWITVKLSSSMHQNNRQKRYLCSIKRIRKKWFYLSKFINKWQKKEIEYR